VQPRTNNRNNRNNFRKRVELFFNANLFMIAISSGERE
jgi:hypothetical protein